MHLQSYNEVNNSYDTAIGANTNLKFASDYDDGASTGIFFTAVPVLTVTKVAC